MGRVNGPLLVAVAAAACLACVALVSLHASRTVELEAASEAQTRWAAQQKEYARDHPVFTRCAAKLDMPEFVKAITNTCGDIHELAAIASPCEQMLRVKSADVGCCWETVMDGYEEMDANAAHKWRLWQGTLSGKSGVTFDQEACGDPQGEKGYKDLTKVVAEQQEEISYLEDGMYEMMYHMYYPPQPTYDSYGQGYYYKGQAGTGLAAPPKPSLAQAAPAARAPVSGGWVPLEHSEAAPKAQRSMTRLQQSEGAAEQQMHSKLSRAGRLHAKNPLAAARGLAEEAASFLTDVNPGSPATGKKLRAAGVNV